jgi:hypothetical protein
LGLGDVLVIHMGDVKSANSGVTHVPVKVPRVISGALFYRLIATADPEVLDCPDEQTARGWAAVNNWELLKIEEEVAEGRHIARWGVASLSALGRHTKLKPPVKRLGGLT